MKYDFESTLELVKKYGQEHLLQYYDILNETQKNDLLEQINGLDFDTVMELYRNAGKNDADNAVISPIPAFDSLTMAQKESCVKAGEHVLSAGKMAVVTMAGGQASRLGWHMPKGTFDIGLPSHKSLFELQCDKMKIYGNIPWYIMTSVENVDATSDFFKEKRYFGYPEELVKIFTQGFLPAVSKDGRILLSGANKVSSVSDGNGGVFLSLLTSGALEDMKKRGVEWVTVIGVDNALVNMADPYFIGYSMLYGHPVSSKSVLKSAPDEKVGVFCLKNNRPAVVEYTEISEEMRNLRGTDGALLYGDSNIICHLFNIESLSEIVKQGLPYHTAYKKGQFYNQNGEMAEEDFYKFETFIFDAFHFVPDMTVFRVARNREFAPVKNKTGLDSPETAKKLVIDFYGIDK